MTDSRRIIPPGAANRPGADREHDQLPRQVIAAARKLRTDRANIEGSNTSPSIVVVGSSRRREVTVYYPADDPIGGGANSATVWLVGDNGDWRRSFPLVPGATFTIPFSGWLYGYTDTSDTPTVFVTELED